MSLPLVALSLGEAPGARVLDPDERRPPAAVSEPDRADDSQRQEGDGAAGEGRGRSIAHLHLVPARGDGDGAERDVGAERGGLRSVDPDTQPGS